MRKDYPNSAPKELLASLARRLILTGLLCLILISSAAQPTAVKADEAIEAAEAPSLDLNGPEAPGLDFATTFVEDEGAVPIVSGNLAVTTDGAQITSATITLNKSPDKSLERLDATADLSGTNISEEYSSSKGILKLSGRDSVENYELVLRTVSYQNSSQAPDTADREVTFIVSDGSKQSTPATSTVAILAVNDAPILDNRGDMHLHAIQEDDQAQIGNYVSTIIDSAEQTGVDRITDPDDPGGVDAEGIAVIEVGDSNGTWQYSLDAGASWSAVGTVNNSSAVLLDETARIRFLPNANYSGIAGFIFRAWDQTTGAVSGERADASVTGGTSAFSTETESVAIDVLAINDPPLVDLNGALPGVEYAASFLSKNEPVAVTSSDAFISDEESAEAVSLIITLTNRPDGAQESLVVGETRIGINGTPYDPATGVIRFDGPASAADYSAVLRSIRYMNTAPTMNSDARIIEFVASDGTEASQVARTTLVPVLSNSAPVLDIYAKMNFSDIPEDDVDPAGDTVNTLLASAGMDPVTDADPGALRGFAVTGADNVYGEWQFSVDAGKTWLAVGQVSDSDALLLSEQAAVRFFPEANFSGETRNISVRAWDQSEGSNGQRGVDVSNSGGITPYSIDTVSIPIYIQPINDAPVLTLAENTMAEFIEGNGPVVVAGPGLHVIDVDDDSLQSATIIIKNLPANEPDILSATTNGSGIIASYDGSSGTLRLTGSASLSDYQAALRSVTFDSLSRDPVVDDRLISFVVGDGSDSSNEVVGTVNVEAINDLPLLDLNGEAAAGTNNDVYFDKDGVENGGSVRLASTLQIQDADNTSLIAAVIHLENRPDGTREAISASVSGTNITAVYGEDGGRIELSGQDSLAAYQQVLRTAVYFNSSTYANRALRKITFSAQDASSGVTQSTARVIVLPQYAHFPFVAQNVAGQPPDEEPNNICQEATPIVINVGYEFEAGDVDDWFRFTLAKRAEVTVELTEFAPEDGQLLVAKGVCGELELLGQNGDYSSKKTVRLGALEAGRYYIWLINDGRIDLEEPYKLRVSAK